MTYQPPPSSTTLTPAYCPRCRLLLGLVDEDGALVIMTIRVAWGVIYCLACGERVEWRQRDAESGG